MTTPNDALLAKNQARLDSLYEVVWDGAKVDECGSHGGLLPPYNSSSSWSLVEEAMRVRWEFAKRLQQSEVVEP